MWRLLRPDAQSVLNDKLVTKSLSRYFSVVRNERPAKFQIARKIPADFNKTDSTEQLWHKHDALTEEFFNIQKDTDDTGRSIDELPSSRMSYLDLKIEIATRVLADCHLCVRRCGVDRVANELGYCRCGERIVVSTIFDHVGEEPELVPSGTIFTMGCTMKCEHCQNWSISQWTEKGVLYTPEDLAKEIEKLRAGGCRNVNLVGGEPTSWLQQWLLVFKHTNVNVPIVWNSNSYFSPETARLLAGFVDVYLLDFKYGPDACGTRISDAPNYWEVCTYNHLEAKKNGELIVRMLVLPDHVECCTRPILAWISKNLGRETRVNIMFQYRPEWRAREDLQLRRELSKDEIEKAIQLARDAGLVNFIT
jgi:putative pyruvate formate lyase activating enzyme